MKAGSVFSFLIFLSSLWLTLPVNSTKQNHTTDKQLSLTALIDQQDFEELIIEPTESDNKKKKLNLFLVGSATQKFFNILINLKSTIFETLTNNTNLDFLLNYVQGFCLSPPR